MAKVGARLFLLMMARNGYVETESANLGHLTRVLQALFLLSCLVESFLFASSF
jgi:hypothetical protein